MIPPATTETTIAAAASPQRAWAELDNMVSNLLGPATRTNLADPWKLGMDRVPDVIGQRRGAIEVVEVRLEPADEVVGSVHAVPTFLSRRASASTAARRCFRAKCSRDLTVPTGVPMASAASVADRPM